MLFTYNIVKLKVEEVHPINYLLQPLKYSNNKLRNKPVELSVCLVISTKPLSNLKSIISKIVIESHVKPIFGLTRKEEDEKLPRSYFESESIHEIMVLGKSCLRFESIDRIIISLREEKDFFTIMGFCLKITEQF